MTLEAAVCRDLVAVLFVTFTFGGGALFLIVSTISENLRKARIAERNVTLKLAMVERGFRTDEIIKVLHAGGGSDV
jgi:hypothetical protein